MRQLGDALLYLLTGVFYWWWTGHLSIFGTAPNFIFLAALSVAIIASPVKALAYGFFFGVYMDLLGANMFGAYALTYTLLVYSIYLMKRHFDMAAPFSQIVTALIMSFVCMLFYQGLSLAMAKINPLSLKNFLTEPFLNAAAAPVVFYIFSRLKRKFDIL